MKNLSTYHPANLFRMGAVIFLSALLPSGVALLSYLRLDRAMEATARLWAKSLLWVCGVHVRVRNIDQVPDHRHYVYIANHLSHMDVLAFAATSREFPRFVVKKELLKVPIFGWALRAMGHIPIDRRDPREAYAIIAEAGKRLGGRKSVFFFGEGTRSPSGELGPFKKGGFAFAVGGAQPIVPVIIRGGRAVLPPHSKRFVPGPMEVIYTDPIETTGEKPESLGPLIERVRGIIMSNNPGSAPDEAGDARV